MTSINNAAISILLNITSMLLNKLDRLLNAPLEKVRG